MAKSTINLGTTPNDRTGDTLRDAGSKVNSNFSELYTALGNGTALNIAVTGATSGQVLKFNGTNFVPAADINTDAVTSVNTLTGAITLTSQNITEPATNPVLAGVAIAGTAGQFTCTATTLAVNQTVTITGTLGGTGTITGYTTGKVYTISVTNGTTSFTLVDAGVAIVTTAGTPTGLTYTPSTLNLYFSNARARAAISASGALAYNSTTGALTFTQGNTDTVAEGTTNQYFTAGRFDFRLSQTTTTSLTEGTNLYFTNARARSAISVSGGLAYDSGTGVISFTDGGGTVTAVSVTSANGFTGTVATSTSTPAITITTSITGVLKGNGTAISAATAGTDYQAPITLTTTGTSGAATFTSNTLNIPQYSAVTTFSALTDATSASLTVDKFYLPAITSLAVTNNGSAAYRFDQYGATDNPTVYAISGTTIAFNLGTGGLSSHPFKIRTSGGTNYNTGLIHVTSAGVVTTESSAQEKTSGTLYWKIPVGTTGNYQYICSNHGAMVGVITIKDISAI